MNIPVKYLMFVSLAGFVLSLLIHLVTWANLYLISNFTVMIFTAGILIVWLQSSHIIREMNSHDRHPNPWRHIFALCPLWLKYITFFLIVYGVLNFILSAEFNGGNRWIDLQVSRYKIRGISGIWMAFYAIGFVVAYVEHRFAAEDAEGKD